MQNSTTKYWYLQVKKGLFYNYRVQTTYKLANLWKKSFEYGCNSANL